MRAICASFSDEISSVRRGLMDWDLEDCYLEAFPFESWQGGCFVCFAHCCCWTWSFAFPRIVGEIVVGLWKWKLILIKAANGNDEGG